MRTIACVAALVLTATAALGQAAKTFEVATVKLAPPLDRAKIMADMQSGHMPNFGAHLDGLRAEYNYMTLKDLVVYAYKLRPYQVVGPDWMTSTRYDVVARLPEGSTKDDAPAMLQALLKDRFGLQTHFEDKVQPVYALVVGKDGPKLKDSPEQPPVDESVPLKPGEMKLDLPDGPAIISGAMMGGQATINMGTRGVFQQKIDMQTRMIEIDGKGVAVSGFADLLNQVMQIGGPGSRLVVDQTGLKGHYEVSLQLSLADLIAAARLSGDSGMPPPPPTSGGGGPGAPGAGVAAEASDPGGNSGSTVAESIGKLGLKLQPSKAPVRQLIVDHADKTPTEN